MGQRITRNSCTPHHTTTHHHTTPHHPHTACLPACLPSVSSPKRAVRRVAFPHPPIYLFSHRTDSYTHPPFHSVMAPPTIRSQSIHQRMPCPSSRPAMQRTHTLQQLHSTTDQLPDWLTRPIGGHSPKQPAAPLLWRFQYLLRPLALVDEPLRLREHLECDLHQLQSALAHHHLPRPLVALCHGPQGAAAVLLHELLEWVAAHGLDDLLHAVQLENGQLGAVLALDRRCDDVEGVGH
mmetsp:Transcript_20493/g.58533  ORF Transcript_20493/g.58533 Transcript_20493/m.58533 type:complete len:237 (-) Transcript_20493:445-1155(-)